MLDKNDVLRFRDNGFLAQESVFTPGEIEEVRALLDGLYAGYDRLPSPIKRDLGRTQGEAAVAAKVAEIDRPTRLDRRLKSTGVFRKCRAIASQLAGRSASYCYDHSIYKMPFSDEEVSWHQDRIYSRLGDPLKKFHFWIPLQDTTVESGCLSYLAGSHLTGLQPHQPHWNGHSMSAGEITGAGVVPCPLRSGGLTVHTSLTLHYSSPNSTADLRRAWILQFRPWGRFAIFRPAIGLEYLLARLRRPATREPSTI